MTQLTSSGPVPHSEPSGWWAAYLQHRHDDDVYGLMRKGMINSRSWNLVLMMIAALEFEPKLIWDPKRNHHEQTAG